MQLEFKGNGKMVLVLFIENLPHPTLLLSTPYPLLHLSQNKWEEGGERNRLYDTLYRQ